MRFDPLEIMGVWGMSPVIVVTWCRVIGDAIWPGPVVLALVKDSRVGTPDHKVVALQLAGWWLVHFLFFHKSHI